MAYHSLLQAMKEIETYHPKHMEIAKFTQAETKKNKTGL